MLSSSLGRSCCACVHPVASCSAALLEGVDGEADELQKGGSHTGEIWDLQVKLMVTPRPRIR
jgi:hypothetical protein